jgi:hypothetical protein
MAQRPSHIPTYTERSALQRLNSREWDFERALRPAGPNTIARMLEKGWIERLPGSAERKLRITQAGKSALKALIPMKR